MLIYLRARLGTNFDFLSQLLPDSSEEMPSTVTIFSCMALYVVMQRSACILAILKCDRIVCEELAIASACGQLSSSRVILLNSAVYSRSTPFTSAIACGRPPNAGVSKITKMAKTAIARATIASVLFSVPARRREEQPSFLGFQAINSWLGGGSMSRTTMQELFASILSGIGK